MLIHLEVELIDGFAKGRNPCDNFGSLLVNELGWFHVNKQARSDVLLVLLASLASGEFGESRSDETNPTAIELALSLRPYVDQTIF